MSTNNEIQTIVVGLTGRIDSMIAAYLLKKQGHNVIGVSIQFNSNNEFEEEIQDEFEIDEKPPRVFKVESRCHIDNLEQVRDICDKLEIPFYAVNAKDEFRDKVEELVIGARASGKEFSPCVYCNVLKMEILFEKAKVLKAHKIATGHYAKIHYTQSTNEYSVMVANDLKNDQSYQLSRLNQLQLSMLIFPLGDTRKDEVIRLASTLKLQHLQKPEVEKMCYTHDPNLQYMLENRVAKSLRKPAVVFTLKEDTYVMDAKGIYAYYYGQTQFEELPQGVKIPRDHGVIKIDPIKNIIYLSELKDFKYNFCFIRKFRTSYKVDKTLPISGFIKFDLYEEKTPCVVYFKTFDAVLVIFDKEYTSQFNEGQFATMYTSDKTGGRVIGGGPIFQIGNWDELDRVGIMMTDEGVVDENARVYNKTNSF